MSWIQKLYETYDHCAASESLQSSTPLAPLSHAAQQAHIEIVIDDAGNFRRAGVIPKENTFIPVTERSSTARTSAVVPHPLCDHVKYCAGDYQEGGEKGNTYFDAYRTQLKDWCGSEHSHPKAVAVLNYIEKKSLVADLVREQILPIGNDGRLLTRWASKERPQLFRQLTPEKGVYRPQNALIRWVVESGSDLAPEVWKDKSLQQAWLRYSSNEVSETGLCMVTGVDRPLATKHSARVRGGKDAAKLISWKKEEESNFVYLGRFLDASQVLGVGRDVSEKAHSALRWLIERQGYRNGDQVVVTWAVAGKAVPDPFQDSRALFRAVGDREPEGAGPEDNPAPIIGDVGQAFATRLNNALAGYRANLDRTDDIVVIALDSATPGRLAITFYRELSGSEFLDRVLDWHSSYAWPQNYGRDPKAKADIRFVGAPSPKDIADAAFGPARDKKKTLHKATVERLLPCIIDGRSLPRDVMEGAVRRTCNRAAFEQEWSWERNLGIACALFKGFFNERKYEMTLETGRMSRDYLYGRLLAIAEHVEGRALYLSGESRDTTAAKLMQRFADRPASTWRSIELALVPYKARLRAKRPPFLFEMEKLLDDVIASFSTNEFLDDRRLSGEFLLGYHCERQVLKSKPPRTAESEPDNVNTDTELAETA